MLADDVDDADGVSASSSSGGNTTLAEDVDGAEEVPSSGDEAASFASPLVVCDAPGRMSTTMSLGAVAIEGRTWELSVLFHLATDNLTGCKNRVESPPGAR